MGCQIDQNMQFGRFHEIDLITAQMLYSCLHGVRKR